MNHGSARIADLIPDASWPEIKKPEPKPDRPPHPIPPKVIGDPTRQPVNKQAAMLVTRAHHLHLPPLPPEQPKKSELESLREEVAKLRAANAQLTHENNALRRKLNRPRCPEHEPKKIASTVPEVAPAKSGSAELKMRLLERLNDAA